MFVEREVGPVCCGIINSEAQGVDYSLITPIWSLAGAQIHSVRNMPERHGATSILDVMKSGQIKAIGANHLDLVEDKRRRVFRIVCDEPELLRLGY